MITSLLVFAAGLLALIVGAVVYGLFNFNRVMALQSRCEQAAADIDVQIRQRHDMIPNIIQTINNFVEMEKGAIDRVLNARLEALKAATGQAQFRAELALGNNLSDLMSVADKFPELRSQKEYAVMRAEISDMENKIAASRRFLNLATNEFNTAIRQFPGSVIAAKCNIRRENFYDLGEDRIFMEDAPVVKPA